MEGVVWYGLKQLRNQAMLVVPIAKNTPNHISLEVTFYE